MFSEMGKSKYIFKKKFNVTSMSCYSMKCYSMKCGVGISCVTVCTGLGEGNL